MGSMAPSPIPTPTLPLKGREASAAEHWHTPGFQIESHGFHINNMVPGAL